MKEIKIIDKTFNDYDKSYHALVEKPDLLKDKKQIKYAKFYLQSLVFKTHTVALIKKENDYICPYCCGIQKDTFNGNSYHCPYCGQKVQVGNEELQKGANNE